MDEELNRFLNEQGLVEANVEFLTDEDIENLTQDLKMKIALKTVRKRLKNPENIYANSDFSTGNNPSFDYNLPPEELSSGNVSGIDKSRLENQENIYTDFSSGNNTSYNNYDLPTEEVSTRTTNVIAVDKKPKPKYSAEEIARIDKEYEESCVKLAEAEKKFQKRQDTRTSKERFALLLVIIFQISFVLGVALMIALTLVNCIIGIIPYLFYIIEIINLGMVIIEWIVICVSMSFVSGFKGCDDTIFGGISKKTPLCFNIAHALEMVIFGLLFFSIMLNFVVGLIPWLFYILEIINLVLMIIAFMIGFIQTVFLGKRYQETEIY